MIMKSGLRQGNPLSKFKSSSSNHTQNCNVIMTDVYTNARRKNFSNQQAIIFLKLHHIEKFIGELISYFVLYIKFNRSKYD